MSSRIFHIWLLPEGVNRGWFATCGTGFADKTQNVVSNADWF
jgi:hypothetical protein